MNIQQLKSELPAYAKDIKLNLESVLTEEGAPDLSQKQIFAIALASAYATQHAELIQALLIEAKEYLSESELDATRAAAAIMAMNNVYYRFLHLVNDKTYMPMPAKLRMNVLANPGMDKNSFELCCLAVSAINGCGLCIDAHTNELIKVGITKQGIQSCIRIAAVINAVAASYLR